MTNPARHLLAPLLLAFTSHAAAQAWPAESSLPQNSRSNHEVPLAWPAAKDDAMQTFVGVRHNATDGTVLGLSLRPSGYPSFMLQLDIVPPGHGPLEQEQDTPATTLLTPDTQTLRTVHKLSLRYRF